MSTLHGIPDLRTEEADENQLKLSRTFVDSMSKSIEDVKFKDKYRDALKNMIQAKIDGKEIIPLAEEERPTIDIMTALKASIEQAKDEKKPMKPASRTGRPASRTGRKASKGEAGKDIKRKQA